MLVIIRELVVLVVVVVVVVVLVVLVVLVGIVVVVVVDESFHLVSPWIPPGAIPFRFGGRGGP